MTEEQPSGVMYTARTAWSRNLAPPLRRFLSTETSSAVVLLAGALAALAWANIDASSYHRVWATVLTVRVGSSGISQDLRHWINDGLMVFFFFVVGLEARREFDLGELRERRRVTVPLLAGIGGMAVPVGIYLAFNAGHASAHGWGAAMSTDTAFALGMLALVGPRISGRLRAFMLTVVVVDDLAALIVIATVYTHHVALVAGGVALGVFALLLVVGALRVRYGLVYAFLGAVLWVAVFESGIDPVIVGLVMGLLTYAYTAARGDLERATERFRSFREQPTPELARSARVALDSAISPNDRLAQVFTHGRATSSCRCSHLPTRASSSTAASSRAPTARRSRSGSSSPTSSANRSASSEPRASSPGRAVASCGCRSAGPPLLAAARSLASASRSRC
jgi:hypothetical protein